MEILNLVLLLSIFLVCLYLLIEISRSILKPNASSIIGNSIDDSLDLSGNSLKWIGGFIFVSATILSIIWLFLSSHFSFGGRALLVIVAGFGLSLFRQGYQKSLPNAKQVLTNDDRNPILFLRSFERDNFGKFKIKKSFFDRFSLNPMSHIFNNKTIEEIIVDMVQPFGPVIAIGRPGENLPPIGTFRHYTASNENWQETIISFMRESSLIVIILDFSEGVLWELRNIVSNNRLKDTIIFYPAVSSDFDYTLLEESWRNNFEKYKLEFPFLISPKIGTVGLMFSRRGEPVELWSLEPDLKELLKRVQEVIYERFEERPIAEGSFVRVGIPTKRTL